MTSRGTRGHPLNLHFTTQIHGHDDISHVVSADSSDVGDESQNVLGEVTEAENRPGTLLIAARYQTNLQWLLARHGADFLHGTDGTTTPPYAWLDGQADESMHSFFASVSKAVN